MLNRGLGRGTVGNVTMHGWRGAVFTLTLSKASQISVQ